MGREGGEGVGLGERGRGVGEAEGASCLERGEWLDREMKSNVFSYFSLSSYIT